MPGCPGNKNYELLTLENGQTVLPLMATAAEYLTELQKLIKPAIIGVGPVEAAINTCRIIERLNRAPDYVVLLGSAGSATLGQGEVYQATNVSYRDMDATPLGFARGKRHFWSNRRLSICPTPYRASKQQRCRQAEISC